MKPRIYSFLTVILIREKDPSRQKLSHLVLRLVKTMTMYMWDLGIKRVVKIEYIILVNTNVFSFIQANCQIPKVDLAR